MRSKLHSIAALLSVLFLAAPVCAAELQDVRFGVTSATQTRIVVDLSGSVQYALSGDEQGQGRLIVDLGGVGKTASKNGKGKGHVASYRLASQPDGGVRLVFALRTSAKIKQAFLLGPRGNVKKHRLVIDVVSSSKQEFIASLPKQYKDITAVIEEATKAGASEAPTPEAQKLAIRKTPTKKPEPRKQASKNWPVIVIDPGHGGGDPGAIGQNGTKEKLMTLAAAVKLADILKSKKRYRVILTRTGDQRLGVRKRAEFARKARPDLFISLHADAIGDPELRGGSIYTLSQEGRARSAQEAQEQADFQVNDLKMSEVNPELGSILLDVTHTATLTASESFASMLVRELNGVTPLLNNSLRTKDLRVLLAPDVPAVLLELAFISNAKDEANLNSPAWRRKTMKAVADAIDEYFDTQQNLTRSSVTDPRQAG